MLTMICRQLTLEKNKQLVVGGEDDEAGDEAGDDVEPVP